MSSTKSVNKNNSKSIEILGTTGYLTATDAFEVMITVENQNPAIINGIAYSFRAYFAKNPITGSWHAKQGFYIDRLKRSANETLLWERDWNYPVTSKAHQASFRAAKEAAEAIDQDQLNAGLISRLAAAAVRAKEDVVRAEAASDAARNLLAEAEAQLAAGVPS